MKKMDQTSKQNSNDGSRTAKHKVYPITGRKPEIFLASSNESLETLHAIAGLVKKYGGKPLIWPEAFPIGEYQLDSLINASRKVDGALILASADDKLMKRGTPTWTPRDNILFKMGLFLSALSKDRAALVHVQSGKFELKLPSDLAGLTLLKYDAENPIQNEKNILKWMSSFYTESLHAGLPSPKGGKYSWHEVNQGLEYIQNKMGEIKFRPDVILGLGRSGGVVGGILASLLGSIPLRLWDLHYTKGKRSVYVDFPESQPILPPDTKRVLIIEGATTSGQTPIKAMESLGKYFPDTDFRFAVLIQSVQSAFTADFYVYLETGSLKPLPWHGPLSRTFLTPVHERT